MVQSVDCRFQGAKVDMSWLLSIHQLNSQKFEFIWWSRESELVWIPTSMVIGLILSLPRVINYSCSLTRNITSHSMENLIVHSILRWKMIIPPILTTSLIHLSSGRLGECTFWTWEWELTLSLPRVINFKFPLQTHQKYYVTQYGELGFS